MWLVGKIKDALKGRRRGPAFAPVDDECAQATPESGAGAGAGAGDDVVAPAHRVAPGAYPSDAPTPSKMAVLLFYISCSFCVLGVILTVRSFFLKHEEDKVQVLTYGTGVSLVGIVLALIMNCINKREHDRFVGYVYRKAREMQADPNSRQQFNLAVSKGLVQEGTKGPYGIK